MREGTGGDERGQVVVGTGVLIERRRSVWKSQMLQAVVALPPPDGHA